MIWTKWHDNSICSKSNLQRNLCHIFDALNKADSDSDVQKKWTPDPYKKWSIYQILLYEIKTHFGHIQDCWFYLKIKPKIPILILKSLFGLKFRHLHSFMKFCRWTNVRLQIYSMTKLFSNSSSKIPKWGNFGPKFKDFYFCSKLYNKINSKALSSILIIVFWISSPNISKSSLFGPKFKDFYFSTKLCS